MVKNKYKDYHIIKRDGIGDFFIFLLSSRDSGVDFNNSRFVFHTNAVTHEFVRLLLPLARTSNDFSFSIVARSESVAILPTYTDIFGAGSKRLGYALSKNIYSMGQFVHKNPLKRVLNAFARIGIKRHIVKDKTEYDRYISFINFLLKEKILDAKAITDDLKSENSEKNLRRIAIFPGASECDKRWHYKKFILTASKLQHFAEVNIILGPSEEHLEDAVLMSALKYGCKINMHICPSAHALVDLLQNSSLVISNDSMAIHLAAYLGVPGICTAWGVRQDRFLGHLTNHNIIIVSECCHFLPCERCILVGDERLKCIKNIKVENVVELAECIMERDEVNA